MVHGQVSDAPATLTTYGALSVMECGPGGLSAVGSTTPCKLDQAAENAVPCLLPQSEQMPSIQACLEAALQLLSRVGSLGPIEAFFVAEELLHHFQARLEATNVLLCRCVHGNQQFSSMKAT